MMLTTICRLYDIYVNADRIILLLEVSGVPIADTSLISNNCDIWYRGQAGLNVVPLRKQGEHGSAGLRIEGAAVGAVIGASAAIAASFVTILAVPEVGPVVGAGWPAAMLGSMAIGGASGSLPGVLTNAGINEEDAHVLVEGVRRGGTLVSTRVAREDAPRIEALMSRNAVDLRQRSGIYRKAGWLAFDPDAALYTADQVCCERALHARRAETIKSDVVWHPQQRSKLPGASYELLCP
ncbi:hypothetical protein CK489_03145 [Bradyrhizobium sp. UFLA03-84]|uniref:hypothetical protein n=1 Tax=Bradyrhizobium sp. UFLA03-84 TaxID=418599 RepID=UPI000BAE1CC0|nr:hypothetical protein [Bradyrhizobium sp. UFLA03-84]PAY09606.1 hypothetical protein CK489_03145 [Bradyrhizobium sp. UFLA03-84]